MRRLAACLALATIAALPAAAEQYWVAYEGNDFPENVGWIRTYGNEQGPRQGGAMRSIANGALVLDSRESTQIYDFYKIERQLNPESGELFVAEWRLRVLDNLGNPGTADSVFGIARDGGGTLSFGYFVDRVTSTREGWELPVTPLDFHQYRVESTDMINYSLWIDGDFAISGMWDLNSLNESFVGFGDAVQGAASLADWDYMRFGVVPEGSASVLLVLMAAVRRPST